MYYLCSNFKVPNRFVHLSGIGSLLSQSFKSCEGGTVIGSCGTAVFFDFGSSHHKKSWTF